LKYDIGEALGVYGENDPEHVHEFIKYYNLDPHQLVAYERVNEETQKSTTEYRTVEQLFTKVIDVFGKPGKKFYQSLVSHCHDMSEREKLGWLASSEGAQDLEQWVSDETPTFADVLRKFPSARPSLDDLLSMIPAIHPRHYSISSSMNVHKTSVHLLVVVVDWKTKSGVNRMGQCTRYLVGLKAGDTVTVSVKPSVMKLPPSHEAPVIMSGLGTGMAPFRAFIEERAYQKSLGLKVGPMVLYFGARHRSEEYLYGEELEAYHHDGVLTHLRLAFSRDQKEKVYIQHKISSDALMLRDMILSQKGAFYLCGPTWPVPDIRDALLSSFTTRMSMEDALHMLEKLKDEERYVLEVY
jgi:sulfite reductase (NADPH) flavoprotein alpha-component